MNSWLFGRSERDEKLKKNKDMLMVVSTIRPIKPLL